MRENFSYEHIKEVISAQLEKRLKATGGEKKKKKKEPHRTRTVMEDPLQPRGRRYGGQVRPLFLTCAFVTLDATC